MERCTAGDGPAMEGADLRVGEELEKGKEDPAAKGVAGVSPEKSSKIAGAWLLKRARGDLLERGRLRRWGDGD